MYLDGQFPGGHEYEHSCGPPSSGTVQKPLQDGQHVGSCLTCMTDRHGQHSCNASTHDKNTSVMKCTYLSHSIVSVGDSAHLFPWQHRHRCPSP